MRQGSGTCCAASNIFPAPNLLHASTTSRRRVHSLATTGAASDAGSLVSKPSLSSVTSAFCACSNRLSPGRSRRAGMENNAHHTPKPPIANRSAFVEPPARCTGSTVTSSTKMPAVYPRAMPSEEMRAVARESFSVSPMICGANADADSASGATPPVGCPNPQSPSAR
jgi:hypothetical protein